MRNYENLFLRYINGLNNFKLSKKEKIKKLTSLNYYLEFLLDQKNISDSEYKKLRQTISKTVYELKYISFQRFLIDLRTRYKTVFANKAFALYLGGLFLIIAGSIIAYGVYNKLSNNNQPTLAYPTDLKRAGRTISFQGRLTDSLGNPITTATDIVFKLYDSSTGGNVLYTGSCTGANGVVPDQDGVINVIIGSDCGMSEIDNSVFTENTEVYLGVTVGSDPEMTPRQPIANVGYAINAETLQGLPPDDGSIAVPFIPYINSAGDMMLALANPAIRSTYESANFEISSANIVTIASAGTGDIVLQATESGTIKFRTQGATDTETRMIIDNLGNVGIGTTNPNYKLEVNGSLYATSMATGSITSTGDIIGERFLDYTNNTFGLDPAGTDMGGYSLRTLAGAILAQTTGNVGIGTTNPTGKLHTLSSGAVTSSNYAGIINNSTTNTTTDGINKYGLYITSTGSFTGSTGTATNNWGLYIDTVSGADNNYGAYIANNVGIGTTSPAQLLDIYQGTTDSDAVIKLSVAGGTGADTYIHFRDNGENKDWSLGVSDSDDLFKITTSNLITTQQVFVIDRNGNVGLGGITNPSYTLDISGTLRATSTVNFSGLSTSTTDQTAIMINSSNNLVKRTLGDLAFTNSLAFTDLSDVPSSYTGSAGYFVKVNSGETGLEFTTASSISPWTETSGNVYLYTTSNKVSIGDTTTVHKLEVEGAITGKALVSLWEKGDQDILVASNGASTASNVFRLTNTGSIITSGSITASSGTITGNILTDQTTTFADANWTSTSAINWDLASSTTALNIESGLFNLDTTNNYVGIGTVSPVGKLHILSSATQSSRIAITETLSSTPLQLINFRYNTNTNLGNIMGVDLGGNSTFYIQATASRYLGLGANASNTPQVIIDTTGNVGIGTTAPTTNLHISGSSGITVGLDASIGTNNTAGKIDLISAGDNAYSTTITTGTQTEDITYTLPTTITANGFLKTDATGVLSWTTSITANSLYWDDLLDPTNNLTLNHSTYTTVFNTLASTQTFFTINSDSLTSGKSLYLSSTSTGLTGSIAEISHSPATSGGTGNLLRLATNDNSQAVPLMITNLGSGLSFRVNDETGDSDTTPFVIDANGNVGIGTTGPGYKLDVSGTARITDQLVLNRSDSSLVITSNNPEINLNGVGADWQFGTGWSAADSSNGLYFYSSTAGKTVTFPAAGGIWVETGNVGIGTTNPQYNLEVNGSFYASSITTGSITSTGDIIGERFLDYENNTFGLDPAGTNMGGYSLRTSAGAILAQTTGNVGIGTTSPSQRLTVAGNIGIQAGANAFIGTLDNYALSLRTNNTNRMFITNTGNVGIGTTAPGEKLHVDPGASGTVIRIGNYTGLGEEYSSGATVLGDNVTLSKSAAQMNIMTTNTSYGARALRLSSSEGLTFHAVTGSVTAGNVFSQELFRITNTGNVGIGTTAPNYKLEVRGNAYFGAENSAVVIDDGTNKRIGFVKQVGKFTYLTAASGVPIVLAHSSATDLTDNVGTQTLTERLYINPSGNVGIGTTNPGSYKLYVNGSLYSTNLTTDSLTVNNSVIAEKFLDKSDQNFGLDPAGIDMNGYSLRISGGAILAQTTGNVGIGTTAPGAKLSVMGHTTIGTTLPDNAQGWKTTLTVTGGPQAKLLVTETTAGVKTGIFSHSSWGGTVGRIGTESSHDLRLMAGYGNDVISITTAGNVGIGTTAPNYKLEVRGNAYFGAENSAVVIDDGTNKRIGFVKQVGKFTYLTAASGVPIVLAHSSATDLTDNVGTQTLTERLYINPSGNVGIGTTNPQYKLEVNGSFYASSITTGSIISTGDIIGQKFLDSTNNTFGLDPAGTDMGGYSLRTSAGAILAQTTGNVGIGTTSPSQRLTVAGNIGIQAGANAFIGTLDNYALSLRTNNTNRMFITNTGNVGIGTTAPGEKLHVDPGASGTVIRIGNYTGLGEEYSSGATVLGDNVTLSKSAAQMNIMTTNTSYGARALRLSSSEGLTFHAVTGSVTAGNVFSQELFRITNTGNVGIGTTNPGARLHITTGLNEAALVQHGQGGGLYLQRSTMGGTTSGGLFLGGGGYTSDADWGHITAGATHDMGSFTARSDAASAVFFANGNIQFRANTGLTSGNTFSFSTRMFIEGATGYVGIGTTSPSYTLDVSGTIRGTNITCNKCIGAGEIAASAIGNSELNNSASFTMAGLTVNGNATLSKPSGQPLFTLSNNGSNAADIQYNLGGLRWALSARGSGENYEYTIWSYNSGWNKRVAIAYSSGNLAIGANPSPTYKLYVNGSAYSTGGWQSSDIRLKNRVEDLNKVLDKLTDLDTFKFTWKKDKFPNKGLPDGTHFGISAQQLQQVFPELINYDNDGYLAVDYAGLSVVNLSAIKELQIKIQESNKTLSLNSEGDVILEKPVNQYTYNSSLNYQNQVSNLKSKLYNLKTITGDTLTRISGFAKVITASIKAGLIETENLIVNNALLAKSIVTENLHLTTDNLTIAGKKLSDYIDERISNYLANQKALNSSDNFVSPVVETGQLNLTNKDSKIQTTTENSKIQITDTNNQTVAEFNTDEKKTTITGGLKIKSDTNKGKLSQLILNNFDGKNTVVIDGNGNASFSGTITAKEVQTDTLKAKKIEAENIQTQIDQIEQRLNQIISNDNNNQIDNEDDKPLYERINEIQQLLADVNNSSLPDVGYYQKLNPELKADFINTNYLNAKNTITTTNLIALNSLAVNNIYIEQNKIMTINEELNLTAEKRIVFFNNQVAISKNGDITTTGVILAKGIITNSIETEANKDLSIKLNGKANKLSIKNDQDKEVASIDNQGSAKFAELKLDKFLPASDSADVLLASGVNPTATDSAKILTENQTAGIGLIPANKQTVKIYSDKAKEDSLIYLTPNTADIKGQLTISKQDNGYFEVFITEINDKDIKFNWLIIN